MFPCTEKIALLQKKKRKTICAISIGEIIFCIESACHSFLAQLVNVTISQFQTYIYINMCVHFMCSREFITCEACANASE